MKHIVGLSKAKPKAADELQDIVCIVNTFRVDLLEAKGGNDPVGGFLQEKCTFGQVEE